MVFIPNDQCRLNQAIELVPSQTKPQPHDLHGKYMNLQHQLSTCLEDLDMYKFEYSKQEEEVEIQAQALLAKEKEYKHLQQRHETLWTAVEEDLRNKDSKLAWAKAFIKENESRLERAKAVVFLHNLMTPDQLETIITSDAGFNSYLAKRFSTDQISIDGETEIQRLEVLLASYEQSNDYYRNKVSAKTEEVEELKAMQETEEFRRRG